MVAQIMEACACSIAVLNTYSHMLFLQPFTHYHSLDTLRATPCFMRMKFCLFCRCLCLRSPCHTPNRTALMRTQRSTSGAFVKCHFLPLHLTNGFTFSSSIEQNKASLAGQDAFERASASRTMGLGYAYLIGYTKLFEWNKPIPPAAPTSVGSWNLFS